MAVVFGTWRQQGESKGDTQRRLHAVFSILPMRSWRGRAGQTGMNHVSDGSGLGNCMGVYEYLLALRYHTPHPILSTAPVYICNLCHSYLFVLFFLRREMTRSALKEKQKLQRLCCGRDGIAAHHSLWSPKEAQHQCLWRIVVEA